MPLTIDRCAVAPLLKERTSIAHTESERILTPKLISIENFDDYAAILKMFYGFYHPVEEIISTYVSSDLLNDIDERRNSKSILYDLQAIDIPINNLTVCKNLPSICSSAQALGSMYVLEGSTLGGRMIAKMLMRNQFVKINESHLHFFNGYKDQTGAKWLAVQNLINTFEEESEIIVAAANETFQCFAKWMEETL